MDMDKDLHIEEFKIRLKPEDAAVVRAMARKLDIPPAVLLRRWVHKEVAPFAYSVLAQTENRRPV